MRSHFAIRGESSSLGLTQDYLNLKCTFASKNWTSC